MTGRALAHNAQEANEQMGLAADRTAADDATAERGGQRRNRPGRQTRRAGRGCLASVSRGIAKIRYAADGVRPGIAQPGSACEIGPMAISVPPAI